jgi:D-glycero-alpha-D-manno-heptose 1-phosphate guanylyltransferase
LPGIPKPMALVAGRPFLEHMVRFLAHYGVREVILSTGHLAEVVEKHFTPGRVRGSDVTWVREETPLGTAGGFLAAVRSRPVPPKAWLVMNGDSLAFAELNRFFTAFDVGGWDAAIVGVAVSDASRYGTLEAQPDGHLHRFAEKRPGPGVINAGIYLFRHETLAHFPGGVPLSFETAVFPRLLEQGCRVVVHRVEAPFLDIGTPETLAQAEAFIMANAHLINGSATPASQS